jgi:alkylation response protein AidB-like acyl-CoA dehydrogenase
MQETELLERAGALQPMLKARASESEAVRRLPADLAQQLARAGLFRMVVPEYLGGLQVSARTLVAALETLAIGDASAAWCVMIGATTGLNAAYMDKATALEIYGQPDVITGGVFAPMGKAQDLGNHYQVSGRWSWGSGSANCSWLCGGSLIFVDGKMKTFENGAPDHRMMLFPASDVELIDTWQVAGLKGTGSGDIAVRDIRVPKARSVSLIADHPVADGALYQFPAFGLLALGVCSVALGNAVGALQAIMDLVNAKKAQGSARVLAESPITQTEIVKAQAALGAARAYLIESVDAAWEQAKAGDGIPLQVRATLRLACTHMTRTAAEVCRTAYDLGGGSALFLESELQRRFRDAHAITQHVVTAPSTYVTIGRSMLGLPLDASTL